MGERHKSYGNASWDVVILNLTAVRSSVRPRRRGLIRLLA
jgi:hypothetical protein